MGQSHPGDLYNSFREGVPLINGPVEFGPIAFSETQATKYTRWQLRLVRLHIATFVNPDDGVTPAEATNLSFAAFYLWYADIPMAVTYYDLNGGIIRQDIIRY